jgi:hypothetical protein
VQVNPSFQQNGNSVTRFERIGSQLQLEQTD